MIIQVRAMVDPPLGATIHFLEAVQKAHAYCGTFGRDMFHTDNLKQVTCGRCLEKLNREGLAA